MRNGVTSKVHGLLNGRRPDGLQSDSEEPPSRTLALDVFEKLRADIVSSRLSPGTKLRFGDLRSIYGVGLSPLREALSRLAESGLVIATGQRGFRVPTVSTQEIIDIAMVRKEIDGLALRLSIQKGDDAWEGRVVASRHKVLLLEKAGRNVAEEVWESRHREFHYTLVSACESPWLLHLHNLMSDHFDRYRRLSAQSHRRKAPRPLAHQRILEAVLRRDADAAVRLLLDHIDEATKNIVAGLASPTRAAAVARRPRRARSLRAE